MFRGTLSDGETRERHRSWKSRLSRVREVTRQTVRGTLLRKTPIPEATAYPQTLVVYEYAVTEAPKDSVRFPDRLAVVHWGTLNGIRQEPIESRRPGNSYSLSLERWEDHPELDALQILWGEVDLELDPYYDVE